jgi:hypothetical protein
MKVFVAALDLLGVGGSRKHRMPDLTTAPWAALPWAK